MMASSAKTLEQQPPKMRASMAPMVSHCGMVSIKMRPARAMARENTGRSSSTPYISAFSSDGAALITRGPGAAATCFGGLCEVWRRRALEVVIYTVWGSTRSGRVLSCCISPRLCVVLLVVAECGKICRRVGLGLGVVDSVVCWFNG